MNKQKANPENNNLKQNDNTIPSDVLGSYTGIPDDGDDKPEQDADDL